MTASLTTLPTAGPALTREDKLAICDNPRTEWLTDVNQLPLAWAALYYVRLGIPIFPCRPNDKRPATENGFHDATTSLEQVGKWWRTNPSYNIGIPTGDLYDVIDIDTKNGAPGLDTWDNLRRNRLTSKPVLEATTPSGGKHWYYPAAGQAKSTSRGHGIDYQAVGGYVLAPPSYVITKDYEGPYTWDDSSTGPGRPVDWAAIHSHLNPLQDPEYTQLPAYSGKRNPDGTPDGLVAYMSEIPAGERNYRLFSIACTLVGEGHGEPVFDDLAAAAQTAGLNGPEIAGTIRSAHRYMSRKQATA